MDKQTEGHRKGHTEGHPEEHIEKDPHMEVMYTRSGHTHGGNTYGGGHTWRGHAHGKDLKAAANPTVLIPNCEGIYEVEKAHLQFLLLWYVCPQARLPEFYNVSGQKSPPAAASTLRAL